MTWTRRGLAGCIQFVTSFFHDSDPSSDAAQPLSFVQRVIGVVVSPGETMARIAAAPRWFDVMALTTVLIAAGFAVFFSTDIGKAAYVDQAVASIESFGGTVNEQMLAGVQRQAGFASWIQGASILFMGPIMAAAIAGILFGVFTSWAVRRGIGRCSRSWRTPGSSACCRVRSRSPSTTCGRR